MHGVLATGLPGKSLNYISVSGCPTDCNRHLQQIQVHFQLALYKFPGSAVAYNSGSQFLSPVSYNIAVNHFTYPQAVTTQCIIIIALNNYPLVQFRLRKIILFYFYFFPSLTFFIYVNLSFQVHCLHYSICGTLLRHS